MRSFSLAISTGPPRFAPAVRDRISRCLGVVRMNAVAAENLMYLSLHNRAKGLDTLGMFLAVLPVLEGVDGGIQMSVAS